MSATRICVNLCFFPLPVPTNELSLSVKLTSPFQDIDATAITGYIRRPDISAVEVNMSYGGALVLPCVDEDAMKELTELLNQLILLHRQLPDTLKDRTVFDENMTPDKSKKTLRVWEYQRWYDTWKSQMLPTDAVERKCGVQILT